MKGIGIGYRPGLAGALLRAPHRVDFVEVVAESCRNPDVRREVVALSRIWPVVLHGVTLSLGSAEGIDRGRTRWLADLARELRSPLVSEHLAFVRAGGSEIGHLTELPLTRASISVIARNVAELRRQLPGIPLLLENVARAFVWPEHVHEMTESAFLHEVTRATGCSLLLDVANLHANAVNAKLDGAALLRAMPLEHVGLVHVAGGMTEDGFYFDTHAHPVPEAVFDLARAALAAQPAAAIMLERDGHLGDVDAIFGEVDRLAALVPQEVAPPARPPAATPCIADATQLSHLQRAMATRLAHDDPAPELARARTILRRKRLAA